MRIIVMGTGPFAVPTCERLLAEGHEIPLVVTRPLPEPPPKKLPPRPVFDWANSSGFDVFEPVSINAPEAIEKLAEFDADLFFVCDYGQILSNQCLQAAKLGGINLHGSLLPRHRGAAPVQWTLLAGDEVAGITVIHMTPKLDAGPCLSQVDTPVEANETAEELEPRLARLGVDATLSAIEKLKNWDEEESLGIIQEKSEVTRAPRFQKSDGQLDFRRSADYLARLVKACQPWPGTFAELQWESGKKLRVIVRRADAQPLHASVLVQSGAWTNDELLHASQEPSACGRAFSIDVEGQGKCIAATTGDGVLIIRSIQPSGKRAMDTAEFLRGHPLNDKVSFLLPEIERQELSPNRK